MAFLYLSASFVLVSFSSIKNAVVLRGAPLKVVNQNLV